MHGEKRLLTYAALIAAVCAPLSTLEGQQAAQPVTLAQFQHLHWLEGTWRGSGGAYAAFYEEYRVVDDSTITMRAFADSAFRVATDSSTIEWRNGTVLKRSARSSYVVVELTEGRVRFLPPGATRGGFTWARTSGDQWTATLHPASDSGRETVYSMRRAVP